jgi:hypothetical protein
MWFRGPGRWTVRFLVLLLSAHTIVPVSTAWSNSPDLAAPKNPGAIEEPPRWIGRAPFDVAAFLALPPADQNAAPLYLDAFFEFDDALAPCFPPEQRDRARSAKARLARLESLYASWVKDPRSLDNAEADALLAECAVAFRKLDLAQSRARCVFVAGFDIDSLLLHGKASRSAARLWVLQAVRALDRGDIDRAVDNLSKIYRLSRDLRPRGFAIMQLVSSAIDEICVVNLLPVILEQSKLRIEHCDRMLATLHRHEVEGVESFTTAIKAEYLVSRTTIRIFEDRVRTRVDDQGRPVEVRLDRLDVARFLVELMKEASPPAAAGTENPQSVEKTAQFIEDQNPDFSKDRRAADEIARELTVMSKAKYSEQVRKIDKLVKTFLARESTRSTFVFKLITPYLRLIAEHSARGLVSLGAAKCLVALRRRQLTDPGLPLDLVAACNAAGLPGVPADPFSDGPLRMVQTQQGAFVYSVGPDGNDHGGVKKVNSGREPAGDIPYRIPKAGSGSP